MAGAAGSGERSPTQRSGRARRTGWSRHCGRRCGSSAAASPASWAESEPCGPRLESAIFRRRTARSLSLAGRDTRRRHRGPSPRTADPSTVSTSRPDAVSDRTRAASATPSTATTPSPSSSTASTSGYPIRRRRLQRPRDDLVHLIVGHRPRPARPRLVDQPLQPVLREPAPPLHHRRHRHPDRRRDLPVRPLRRAAQHDPRPGRQRLRRLRPAHPALQHPPLLVGQFDRHCTWPRHTPVYDLYIN